MHAVLVIELQGLNINYSLLTVFGGVNARSGETCPVLAVKVMNAEWLFRERERDVFVEVEEVKRGSPEACLQKCRVATLDESGSHSCFKSTLPRNKHKELPHLQQCRPFSLSSVIASFTPSLVYCSWWRVKSLQLLWLNCAPIFISVQFNSLSTFFLVRVVEPGSELWEWDGNTPWTGKFLTWD